MIPTIHQILVNLLNGTFTKEQAEFYINENLRLERESTPPEALPKDDVPLKCEVIDGAIQFIVGEKVLAHATNICPRFYDAEQDRGMYHVTDQVAFAKDVARELNREREDGSTRLSDMMDDAIAEAISHGAEGVEETPSPLVMPTEKK